MTRGNQRDRDRKKNEKDKSKLVRGFSFTHGLALVCLFRLPTGTRD